MPMPLRPLLAFTLMIAVPSCADRAAGSRAEVRAAAESAQFVLPPVTPHPAETDDERALVRDGEAAVREWLEASQERAPGATDSVPAAVATPGFATAACDGGTFFPSPLLARYELLPSQLRGDTVVARARVTTVAEQDIDRRARNRFTARQRVRTDVLEWDVIPVDGSWAVCNGIRFGYRGADTLTTWIPEGSSHATARALADSIRRANP